VALEAGGVPLLARVTRKSAQLLALAPGQPVFAQIKGVAVLD
ncbi:MAG: TOBE domain-containing protein, partial [Ottowia sp.]|nr:TOBE domain-containing protein [Ottowia sp.]